MEAEFTMKRLADGIEQLDGFPPNSVNCYFADGILFDAGLKFYRGRYLRQLRSREVQGHALTHAHPDHQGASRAICDAFPIPLWCGAVDAEAVESGRLYPLSMPRNPMAWLSGRLLSGPACPVSRRLVEGDMVGGFRVIDVPGHSPGHVAYWREPDRVLILGDVLTNMNVFTSIPGLHQPPSFFTVDPALNRRSARKILELGLEPELVCFGHGPPLKDTAKFLDFLRKLPE
jgi:glyoxylase-like metal-dependent hydrolase (beta-lactamase superfamily II)